MENKEIQTVINGQPGERPIADEIKNVLFNSPDSDEWRRDFVSQWQCVIFVLYQPSLTGAEPSAVALVVIPDSNENEFYFDQLSFRVRLVGVQDAVGVWPAIERLGQRLSEIGRLLKGIRDVFGLVHTEAQEQALRILFEACKGNLYDSTGFELFMCPPCDVENSSRPSRSPDDVALAGHLEATLQIWLGQVTSCANHSISRVQGNLAAVNFKADKTWSLVVGGNLLAGSWGYETEHESTRVSIYGRHDFHVPPLRPTKFEDWPKWESAPFELALTDQDFNGEPGWLKACEIADEVPVFNQTTYARPSDSTAASVDFNVDA